MKLTARPWRLIAATVAACCALLVPGIALATQAGTAAPAVTPFCETPGLVIWINTSGNSAAGSTFYKLQFTNLSGHACTLNGFPFVRAVNLRGQNLGRRAAFSGTPHVVTLRRGQTVKAVLQIVNVNNFSNTACGRVTAAGLRVFPPNQTRSKVVPFPFRACSKSGPVFLTVRPVTK